MKAAILEKLDSDLSIWDLEPDTLQSGQILVKMITSGLCGAQLQEISGLKGNAGFLPHLLGHEGCGIVEDFADDVKKVKKGDKVIVHWRKGTGIESAFPSYIDSSGNKISGGKATTLSELAIISENRVTVVPQNTDEDFCTLLGCGLSTGLGVVAKDAKLQKGETVVILGSGGIGLSCVLSARIHEASQIACVDISDEKRSLVEGDPFSAKFFNTLQTEDATKLIPNIDCLIDTTGCLSLVSEFIPFLADKGRCILVSQPRITDNKLTIKSPIKLFPPEGITIKTSQGGGFNPDTDIPFYIDMYQSNSSILKKGVDKLITHKYSLSQINEAIKQLRSGGKTGRILINL